MTAITPVIDVTGDSSFQVVEVYKEGVLQATPVWIMGGGGGTGGDGDAITSVTSTPSGEDIILSIRTVNRPSGFNTVLQGVLTNYDLDIVNTSLDIVTKELTITMTGGTVKTISLTDFVLTTELETFIEPLEMRVGTLETTVTTLETDVTTLQTDVSNQELATTDLNTRVTTNTSDITTLQNDVVTMNEDLGTITTDVATLQSDVATNTSDISALTTVVDGHTTELATLATDLGALDNTVVSLASDVGVLQNDVSVLRIDVDILQADVTQTQTDITALDIRVTDTETINATQTSDINTIFTTLNTIDGDITGTNTRIDNLVLGDTITDVYTTTEPSTTDIHIQTDQTLFTVSVPLPEVIAAGDTITGISSIVDGNDITLRITTDKNPTGFDTVLTDVLQDIVGDIGTFTWNEATQNISITMTTGTVRDITLTGYAMEIDLQSTASIVATLVTDVSDIQVTLGTLATDVSTLQTNVSDLTDSVDSLSGRTTSNEAGLADLETSLLDYQKPKITNDNGTILYAWSTGDITDIFTSLPVGFYTVQIGSNVTGMPPSTLFGGSALRGTAHKISVNTASFIYGIVLVDLTGSSHNSWKGQLSGNTPITTTDWESLREVKAPELSSFQTPRITDANGGISFAVGASDNVYTMFDNAPRGTHVISISSLATNGAGATILGTLNRNFGTANTWAFEGTAYVTGDFWTLSSNAGTRSGWRRPSVASMIQFNKTGFSSTVTAGSTLNLCTLLSLADVTDSADLQGAFSITSGNLRFPNTSKYTTYTIVYTLYGTIASSSGTAREFSLEMRRSADDSLVRSSPIIKVSNNVLDGRGVPLHTYTQGTTDPYITNGLKLVFNNISPVSVTITGFNLLIQGT